MIVRRFEDKRFKFVKPNLASGRKKKELKRLRDELRQHSSDSSEISNGSDTSSKSQTVEIYTSLERNDNSFELDSSFEDVSNTPSLFAIRENKNEARQFKIMISSPIAANKRNEFKDPNLSEIVMTQMVQ